ncbi:MAG: hypothetical protein ACI9E1_001327 [Cryomorphaceae bacterium]|jgi:hypothetical protein
MKIFGLLACLLTCCNFSSAQEKVIHVFVALCDNQTQGIQPVGKAIGDGDKPDANLYWGCSDGMPRYFAKSKLWKKLETHKPQSIDKTSPIMRRIIFQHNRTGTLLVADAYQGKHIKQCITNYLNASSGSYRAVVEVKSLNRKIRLGADSALTAYIGHNGLMEFKVDMANVKTAPVMDTITLCCISDSYFNKYLKKTKTTSILQTKSLMYPGSFILHDALEGWFRGETKAQIRTRAAKAYAKNQKISVKGGYSIFKKLEEK